MLVPYSFFFSNLNCSQSSEASQQSLNGFFVLPASRPLLVCIGLNAHTANGVREIMAEILAHPVW